MLLKSRISKVSNDIFFIIYILYYGGQINNLAGAKPEEKTIGFNCTKYVMILH
jgi:hypothetical protein